MIMRSLSATTDRATVARLFPDAADYVLPEYGRAPDEATMDNYFNERPPNVGAEDAVHIRMFDADSLIGILGVVFGYPDATDSYIGLLLLAPHALGKGVGGHAVAHAATLAKARGSTRQLVAVLDNNPKGRAFWKREGFVLEKSFLPTNDGYIRHRMMRAIYGSSGVRPLSSSVNQPASSNSVGTKGRP
jgi:GNAT superfamily N-acetyltransferase